MFDACIIGAGVVGGFVARELTRYGLSVVIVEKESDVAMGATRANSAIVHAGFDAKVGSLKARLNVRGSEMMESVCRELGVKYRRNGSLVVGFDGDDEATLSELLSRGEKNGVRGLKLLSRDEVVALEPNIGDEVTAALYAPTGAIVCPYELCMAAIGNAMDNGAMLKCSFEVTEITDMGDFCKVKSSNEEISARFVINCAGLYSDKIAEMCGVGGFSITPRRGEYLLLDREVGDLISHTVFRCPSAMGKGMLVTPTVDGNLLLGPTAENILDKEDKSTTREGLAKIRSSVTKQVRGIDMRKVITSFTGLRAVGSTGDFIINAKDKFINVAAIESPGLSASPAIAEYVREMLGEMGVEMREREDFVKTRRPMHYFRELSIDEKNEIIKENPSFAQVICRCETVTEGEILEAIRTNPRPTDLDGVKRRTRASMGRCQGGFCTPYITELLARELSVDCTEVTKFGGGSRLIVGKTKEAH
ncbi:MAG: NAD(P)/FAD-dependent oxidoreductase [Clostridia bacterium]|nr:NAD(P)/FAD-dependent oxidoreductase [Clostridia bacterium]